MNKIKFENVIQSLPKLLSNLENCPLQTRDSLKEEIPQKGIYVFYERNRPIYVGRSNNLRRRIQEHGRTSSDRFSATFAFKLAKDLAKKRKIFINWLKPNAEIEKNPKFHVFFANAKKRVSKMYLRYLQVDEPIRQAIGEIYFHLKLRTKYNDFDNH